MFKIFRLLLQLGKRSFSAVTKVGKASGKFLASPKARVAGKWFWRALDVVTVGSLVYDLYGESDDAASVTKTNNAVMDAILSKSVLLNIHTVFDDESAFHRALTNVGLQLMGSPGLPEISGLSLILSVSYVRDVGSAGFAYSFDQMKEILGAVSDQILVLYPKAAQETDGFNTESFQKMLAGVNEEDLDFDQRRNLDYVAYFFDNAVTLAAVNGDTARLSNPIPISTNNSEILE